MASRQTLAIELTLTAPTTVSHARLRVYIEEAIDSWGGQYDPGNVEEGREPDPLFYGCRNVEVGRITRVRAQQTQPQETKP